MKPNVLPNAIVEMISNVRNCAFLAKSTGFSVVEVERYLVSMRVMKFAILSSTMSWRPTTPLPEYCC